MSSSLFVIDFYAALQVITLGFVGGILSGFIGSGGAFFMTPGMMNLGIPGIVAVGSNIAHKFGKAMMGSKKHGELGNVDKRLGSFLILTSFIGIRIAVWIVSFLFQGGQGSHGEGSASAASDLYISTIFITILSIVGLFMFKDVRRSTRGKSYPPGRRCELPTFSAKCTSHPISTFRLRT